MTTQATTPRSPADRAIEAVYRRTNGETITLDTLHAGLVAEGMTAPQAATTLRLTTALIPTVTPAAVAAWRNR